MAEDLGVVVRNPNSGDGHRTERAHDIARERGYEVHDSTGGDNTIALAREAVEGGASRVVACGGDGTLNRVVQGVLGVGLDHVDAPDFDALGDVELGVVPAGTGNDFADNVGIRGVEHAFEVMASGEPRLLDVGMAAGKPFLNSCVGGLTADASARTSPAAKRRLGVLAYVLSTLQEARDFDALTLEVTAGPEREPVWSGEALMLLVGNGRRFPGERMRQANVEDGLMNVVIIEDRPALDYLARGAATRLLGRDSDHLTRVRVPHLEVTHEGDPVQFSLDGEFVEATTFEADCRHGAMRFFVGPDYDPSPEEWGEAPTG